LEVTFYLLEALCGESATRTQDERTTQSTILGGELQNGVGSILNVQRILANKFN
jgi:hypothetical protein